MAELPTDALAVLLDDPGSPDALELLMLLLRHTRDRATRSGEHLATTSSDGSPATLERRDAADADRRLQLLGVMHSAAMDHLRALAVLLARARGMTDSNAPGADEQVLEHAAHDDGFLERAARRGITLVALERAYVHAVLHVVGGNKSAAARRLGINRRTLQRRLDDVELDEDEHDEEDENEADEDPPRMRSDHGGRGSRL
ncbi:MAG TPA: helix-turn-helix domain-containing protein [Nannocystaceae bacterium]|nr:helix-turn-helix domain-containing protein [Nannocystaceae bacterium]